VITFTGVCWRSEKSRKDICTKYTKDTEDTEDTKGSSRSIRDSDNHGRSCMEVGTQDWNRKHNTGNKAKERKKMTSELKKLLSG